MFKFKNFFAVWLSFLIVITGVINPETASSLTIKEEKELSDEFLRAVFMQFEIIKDPVIDNYINAVGQKILAEMPVQPFSYKFYAIHQDTHNAFAGPAGNIFIFSGLFETLENENELAALLAHEIAHVSCRHISEMLKKSKKTSMATLAGVIAGILIGIGGASAVGSALTIGSMAAGQSVAMAYSRENEMQSDQVGRTYLQKAGYNLDGLLSILKKIRAAEWYDTEEFPTYLRTHPATEDRIIYLDNLLGDKPPPVDTQNYEFQLAHTRLVSLYGNSKSATQQFKNTLKNNPKDTIANYGYGLLLGKTGNLKAAIRHLTIASENNPDDPTFKTDLGRLYYLAGDYSNSMAILKPISNDGPESYLYLGRSQMALNRYEDADATFTKLLKKYPDHEDVLFFLGQAKGNLNQLAGAHYNLGKYYEKKTNPTTATFHFKKALEYEKAPEQIKKINEHLKDLKDSSWSFISDDDKDTEKNQ